MIKKLLKSLA